MNLDIAIPDIMSKDDCKLVRTENEVSVVDKEDGGILLTTAPFMDDQQVWDMVTQMNELFRSGVSTGIQLAIERITEITKASEESED